MRGGELAQRGSGYIRQHSDAYWTPQWVYNDLRAAIPDMEFAVDVAPRERNGYDFLADIEPKRIIATNPPFNQADEFVLHALNRTRINMGMVAMLLPHTWDTANKRIPLWLYPFRMKLVLTKRIRWENIEQKVNGPSTNHAWYIWDWGWERPPMMGWM